MLKKSDYVYKVFEKEIKKISRKKKVIDVGTSKRFAKEMECFKDLFSNNYLAVGYKPQSNYGEDNCDIDADILSLPFGKNSIDAIICLDVLEHVSDPFKASRELFRVLKSNGTLLLTTPFLLPYHGKSSSLGNFSHETYPDFWRFTHQGLELLFRRFKQVKIIPFSNTTGYYANQIFKFDKISLLNTKFVQQLINKIKIPRPGCATYRHLVIATK
jgi:ubiquinone/menaquinone biosynthesis C-methylase UbiE